MTLICNAVHHHILIVRAPVIAAILQVRVQRVVAMKRVAVVCVQKMNFVVMWSGMQTVQRMVFKVMGTVPLSFVQICVVVARHCSYA